MKSERETSFADVFRLIAICLSLNGACSGAEPSATNAPVAILGLGIRNEVELGMTLDQARRKRPDLVIRTNRFGPEPHGAVTSYSGTLAALGLEVLVTEKHDPISAITLMVDPARATNRFNGSLSCGFSFQGGQSITRAEIVRLFGNPWDPQGTNMLRHLLAGRSVVWKPDSETEVLCYPTSGVGYRLKAGIVDVVTIVAVHTNSPNRGKVRRIPK